MFIRMLRATILVFAAVVVLASATKVNECGTNDPHQGPAQISVSGCDEPTCVLKQGTTTTIKIRFTPKKNIQSLINKVGAILFNVSLPFVGVDGTNACDNIYTPDSQKVECPLQADVEYIYKNSFPILPLYPKVALIVHYALQEGKDDVICFEIPSKITK